MCFCSYARALVSVNRVSLFSNVNSRLISPRERFVSLFFFFFFFIFKFDQTTTFLQTIAARTTEKNRVFVFKAKGDCIAKRTFNLFFSQQRGGHYRRTGVATSRYFARDKLYAPRVPTTKQTEATTVKSDRKSFSSSMRDGLERFSLLRTRGEMFSRFD